MLFMGCQPIPTWSVSNMQEEISHEVAANEEGMTFLAVLEANGHVVDGKISPEYGMFVTSIDGESAPEGFSWSFKINGEFTPVGVSSQLVEAGQVLTCRIIAYGDFPQE